MTVQVLDRRFLAIAFTIAIVTASAGCGSRQPPPAASAPAEAGSSTAAPATTPTPAAPPVPVTAADVAQASWTPEALEELLAPVALYPDPVLSQVLIASTNPQEVLDAGNWLVANEGLEGKSLDDAAAQVGFTPPVRALVQFPQTIDMMCMEMGWTTELGQAFVADQSGVLDAVQRLRRQAMDVGNLKTSSAMIVETTQQEDKEVVVLKPSKPEVVYVPTYDPQAAYAPAAVAPATAPAPVEDKTKYDTGDLVMTGVLAFGAGILVNELFDDDDDNRHDYYYPNYGYGGMPYYPPYPYRPVYGGGYYPSNGYNRPPNWNSGFQNNGNIIINTGNRPGAGGGYWDRYDGNRAGNAQPPARSPITAARPNRPELADLNQRKPRPMPADYRRPAPEATAANWKGQTTYQGRDKLPPGTKRDPAARIAEAQPGYSKPAGKANTRDANRPAPKVQGSYAVKDRPRPDRAGTSPGTGDLARPRPATRDAARPAPAPRDVAKPPGGAKQTPAGDRGYGARDVQPRAPQTRDVQRPPSNLGTSQNRGGAGSHQNTALSGAGRGGSTDRAASQRGKQSLPQGARSKGAGGGGGGKNRQQAR